MISGRINILTKADLKPQNVNVEIDDLELTHFNYDTSLKQTAEMIIFKDGRNVKCFKNRFGYTNWNRIELSIASKE